MKNVTINHGEMYEDFFEGDYKRDTEETRDEIVSPDDISAAFIGAEYILQLCLSPLRNARDKWREIQDFDRNVYNNPGFWDRVYGGVRKSMQRSKGLEEHKQ
jgi:hypothetical protein